MEDIISYGNKIFEILADQGAAKVAETFISDLTEELTEAGVEGAVEEAVIKLLPKMQDMFSKYEIVYQHSSYLRKQIFASRSENQRELDLFSFLSEDEKNALPDGFFNDPKEDEEESQEEDQESSGDTNEAATTESAGDTNEATATESSEDTNEAVATESAEDAVKKADQGTSTRNNKKKSSEKKRKSLLDSPNLPVTTFNHDTVPSDPDMVISGYHCVSKLGYTPAQYTKEMHYYPIYKKPDCYDDNGNDITEIPGVEADLIEGSPVTEEALSHAAFETYGMGVPGYRQSKTLLLRGIYLSRQTIFNWMDNVYEIYLDRVVQLMGDILEKQDYVHLDESTMVVVENKKEKACNYLLCVTSGRSEEDKITYYLYSPTRDNSIVPAMIGDDFCGTIQTDGYAAYKSYAKAHPDVTHAACWAHVQIKFKDALGVDNCWKKICELPAEELAKELDLEKNHALREFYTISRLVGQMIIHDSNMDREGMSWDEILEDRQKIARPVMDMIFEKAKNLSGAFPKANKKGKAIQYLLNHEEQLRVVLKDGRCEMTNLPVERKIKNFVLWRKNSLFSNTEKGAVRMAGYMTVLQTAFMNGVDPEKYLTWLLKNMKSRKIPDDELREMLPFSKTLPKELRIPSGDK